MIFLDGGPSHHDLFDLKPDAPDEIRGPFQPIATSVPGVPIGELLPHVARQMHRLTLIRSVRHDEAVRERYGRHRHGLSVLLAQRLAEAGARFVTVHGGTEEQDWTDGQGARLANNSGDARRDHCPGAFTMVFASAGVPRGVVIGATDRHASAVTNSPVTTGDITATNFAWRGLEPSARLTGPAGWSPAITQGRPNRGLAT